MDSSALVWLAIIAIAMILQLIGMAVTIVVVLGRADRAIAHLEAFRRETEPLIRQAATALEEMHDMAERVRRAEASAQAVAERVTATWATAKRVAWSRVWPIVGAVRVLKAMTKALRERSHREDRNAESRFVYEGGIHASN